MKKKGFFSLLLSAVALALGALAASGMEVRASEDVIVVGGEEGGAGSAGNTGQSGEVFDDGETLYGAAAKATTSAAKITACRGYRAGEIRVQARVSRPVKSRDNYYYLFRVNTETGEPETQAARKKKAKSGSQSLTFTLKTGGHPEYAVNKYCIAVKTGKGSKAGAFTRISATKNVESPEKAAANRAAYKLPKTKKGLQTTEISQLTRTGSKTAFCNLQMSTVMTESFETVSYEYNGKTYYFSNIGGYQLFVSQCNRKGIQVTMQLMLDWSPATRDVISAGAQQPGVTFYDWETADPEAKQKMEAVFSFLAEMFGTKDCYVSNWVLGNEVNSCNLWNYPGNKTKAEYVKSYTEAFRCLYNAVRSQKASSKVFICVDHLWNMTTQGYGARDMIDSFASRLKKIQKNVQWNLAYHAYPFPLTDCRFWGAETNPAYRQFFSSGASSKVVSLNNLSVMTNYIKKKYGSGTRIILSEQGFTSSQGQDAQAAAIALGYYVAACDPMVDAFIIRSYSDEAHETAQGLSMGIAGKKAMKVFQNMDSSGSLKYTKSYLNSQVGKNWKKWAPGFSASKLSKTYRRQ